MTPKKNNLIHLFYYFITRELNAGRLARWIRKESVTRNLAFDFPEKLTGVQYSEFLSQLHFWIFFVGVNITFFPMVRDE